MRFWLLPAPVRPVLSEMEMDGERKKGAVTPPDEDALDVYRLAPLRRLSAPTPPLPLARDCLSTVDLSRSNDPPPRPVSLFKKLLADTPELVVACDSDRGEA